MTNQVGMGGDRSFIAHDDKRIAFGPAEKEGDKGIRYKKSVIPWLEKIFVEFFGRLFKQNFSVAKVGNSTILVSRDSLSTYINNHKDAIKGLHSIKNIAIQELVHIVKEGSDDKKIRSAVDSLSGDDIGEIINKLGKRSQAELETTVMKKLTESYPSGLEPLITTSPDAAKEALSLIQDLYQKGLGSSKLTLEPKKYITDDSIDMRRVFRDVLVRLLKETYKPGMTQEQLNNELKLLGPNFRSKLEEYIKTQDGKRLQQKLNEFLPPPSR